MHMMGARPWVKVRPWYYTERKGGRTAQRARENRAWRREQQIGDTGVMTPPAAPPAPRPMLAELAQQGTDKLTAELHRALPGDKSGRVAVAAFNSSI